MSYISQLSESFLQLPKSFVVGKASQSNEIALPSDHYGCLISELHANGFEHVSDHAFGSYFENSTIRAIVWTEFMEHSVIQRVSVSFQQL